MKRAIHTILYQLTGNPRYKKLARGMSQIQIDRIYVRSAVTGRVRREVLKRDNWTCVECHRRGLPLEVDHRIAVANGGTSKMSNLQTLCWECNRAKGKGE